MPDEDAPDLETQADEPSLLDMLQQLGGTRLPTGAVEMSPSLMELLRSMGGSGTRAYQQIMQAMGGRTGQSQGDTNWYWDARHPKEGGTGQLVEALAAPSAGHYRVVPTIEHAKQAMAAGESPLYYPGFSHPGDLDPARMPALQQEQYASPGGEPWFLSAPGGGLTLNPAHFPS